MSVEGFLRMSNNFNWFTNLRPVAFRIAVYLASKPDTWKVREADVRKRCKGIGHEAYGRAIGELVDAGLLERGARSGHGTEPPLILTELYLRVRAGHNESRKADFRGQEDDSAGHNESRKPDFGITDNLASPQVTTKVGYPTSETRPVSKTDSRKTDSNNSESNKTEPVVVFADDSLDELVSNAPDPKALESLWRVHRAKWTPAINTLASARKAELKREAEAKQLASANEPELASASVSVTQPAPISLATDSSFDVDDADETVTVYDADEDDETGTVYSEAEPSRFMSRGSLSYRPSLSSL